MTNRRTYRNMDNEMVAIGFEPQETGGGCMAYVRNIQGDSEYEMVTDADDAALPESFDTPVVCGLYVDGEMVSEQRYASLQELLDSAQHLRK